MTLGFGTAQIDQFNARSAQKNEPVRRLVAVAPVMVRHREGGVRFQLAFDFARSRVAPFREIGTRKVGNRTGPDEPVGNEDIRRGIEALCRRATPQLLAALCRESDQVAK